MGGAWGERDDAESLRTLNHAIESGINVIDTAGFLLLNFLSFFKIFKQEHVYLMK